MNRIRGFPPIADPAATTLILGSMPGVASLRAGRYYAHPRNLFWPIVGELLGMDPELSYAGRVERLVRAKIALWDVLKICTRAGSLDAAIESPSAVPNDFATFFAGHRRIRRVFFNGAAAERLYRRYAAPRLPAAELTYARLPSTSPAHAALSYPEKLAAWRVVTSGGAHPRR